MKRHAVIKKCREEDKKSGRKYPKSEQEYCLWDKNEKEILFAGSKSGAEQHEKDVNYFKHQGSTMTRKYIRLAEVPESAIKDFYNPKWGQDIMKAIGGEEDMSPKTSQYLFKTVWNAVIQLMDKALMSMYKLDTTEYAKDPTFVQALAGLAYFVTDDGLRTALGVKSDSLQKAKGHLEALMATIGQEAPVDETLKGLKQQAAPVVKKAFDGIVKFLKEEMPDKPAPAAEGTEPAQQQMAASVKKIASPDIAAAVAESFNADLDEFVDWFESDAGAHYWPDFERLERQLVDCVAGSLYAADTHGDGDLTGMDYCAPPVVNQMADILFKLSPDWTKPRHKKYLQDYLNDMVDGAVDSVYSNAAPMRSAANLPWNGKPDQAKKAWDTLTKGKKHKMKACIKKMSGVEDIEDPAAHCKGMEQAAKRKSKQTKEATMKPILYKGCKYAPAKDRDRDSAAPAMQMTQQRYKQEKQKAQPAKQAPTKGKKEKPAVDSKVKSFFKKLLNFPTEEKAAQKEAIWGEKVSSYGRIAKTERKARKKGCGCRDRAAGTTTVKLPTSCVEQIVGTKFSKSDTTTFTKKDDHWFVEGVDSNGVVDDTLVSTMKSYCEMMTTASRKARTTKRSAAAMYDYETGDVISEGLQGATTSDEAINMAMDEAAALGAPVLLVDDDGEFVVYPDGRVDQMDTDVRDEAFDDDYGSGFVGDYASYASTKRRAAPTGFYSTDVDTFYVAEDGDVWIVQSEDAGNATVVPSLPMDAELIDVQDEELWDVADAIESGSIQVTGPRHYASTKRTAETFRGFRLDAIPDLANGALAEIKAKPEEARRSR